MDINKELQNYCLNASDEGIDIKLETAIKNHDIWGNRKDLSIIFNCLDCTSLNVTDTEQSIATFLRRIRSIELDNRVPSLAAVCLFPNFVNQASEYMQALPLRVAAVAGSFPASQSFKEIKLTEIEMAIKHGCDEIDYVMPVGKFIEKDYQYVYEDIKTVADICHKNNVSLKLIIESGELCHYSRIFQASIIALLAGADFIKTSTGKVKVNAKLSSVFVMTYAIQQFYKKTGEKRGIKIAGGIHNSFDAVEYLKIVNYNLGEEWFNNSLLRFGSSSLFELTYNDLTLF
ncbi:MAG: deoxyribose-phosphate aldolase [Marinifilaceae bacterium]|jgi:deoxyribose-phosphate aldolase|nr:deoxyribose-phosphate aldolase [Marinifilaceae bacterium]